MPNHFASNAAASTPASAHLERAALQLAEPLGGDPLLIPRARPCIAGWLGRRHESAAPDASGASIDIHAFPIAPASLGVPAAGLPGFRRGHREALAARRIARLTHLALGSNTLSEGVALTALASVDAERAREFVMAEPGPRHRHR